MMSRRLMFLFALLALAVGVRVAVSVWPLAVHSGHVPHWDAAAHGWAGVRMAHAIEAGDRHAILDQIQDRSRWAPLFPILEAPALIVNGDGYAAAAAQMPCWFAFAVLCVFLAGASLGGLRGLVTGAIAATLYATSGYMATFATMTMLEVPGVALLMLATAAYIRYCRTGRARDAHLTAIATTILFFHKFNYAILWMAPLALNELGRSIPSPRRLFREGPPQGIRSILLFTVVPIALWLASPRRLLSFLSYMEGLPEAPMPLSEHLVFHARSFILNYTRSPWLGAPVLVAAFAMVTRIRRLPAAERILPVAFLAGFALTTIHVYKFVRFFYTIAPFAYLSCGLCMAMIVERLAKHPETVRRVSLATAGVALGIALVFGTDMTDVRTRYLSWMPADDVREVMRAIGDVHARSHGTALLGVWNQLSFPLLEWDLMLQKRNRDAESRPKNAGWPALPTSEGVRDRLAGDAEIERLMVLDLHPDAPAWHSTFDKENPGHAAIVEGLRHDARFTLEEVRTFPATGYALYVFRTR